ncbi:MAG: T9SS type A sorting domain-containing protein [Melioribacteraceae bacterium]|nr:T9SS type A sorting domain-containing protein [Melioribacteraceae bacterium]
MRNTYILLMIIFLSSLAYSQTIYDVEPGTSGNEIYLSLENISEGDLSSSLFVKEKSNSEFIEFTKNEVILENLKTSEIKDAYFKFDIKRDAPVNELDTLKFLISNKNGYSISKDIIVKYLPPSNFELEQNYPNPFNPSTKIRFQLPQNAKVTLKIYDILGSEVTTLINQNKTAGFHEVNWQAINYSSGTYIYQLIAEMETGVTKIDKKKMLLLK